MEVRSCRCCLSPGILKDLNSSYLWLNNKEVYVEMLQECFGITLKMSNKTSKGICEDCIKFLRKACNFKRQVLHNEHKLLKSLSKVQKIDQKPYDYEVKVEGTLDYGHDSDDYFLSDTDDLFPDVKLETSQDNGDDLFLSSAEDEEDFEDDEEQKDLKPKKSTRRKSSDEESKVIFFDLGNLRKLFLAAVQHSTMMPFRWHSNKYLCFYCCSSFSASTDLRNHTDNEHKKPDACYIQRTVKSSSKLKLDITDITCKICSKKFDNLTQYFEHLIKKHNMNLKKELSEHISTFKLSDDGAICLACGQKFRFFSTLISHMNQDHVKRSCLCEICGNAFNTKHDVVRHVQTIHTDKSNKKTCNKCFKSYSSEIALSDHMKRMHRRERLQCTKCPEILGSPYLKKRHMALVHDVKQFQFNCDLCSKRFLFMSKLARHKAMTHMKEKNCTCVICGFKVYNKELLKKHMVRHDDARPFQCDICEKSFPRKKTLMLHIRAHMRMRECN